jgi:hypothetical protein
MSAILLCLLLAQNFDWKSLDRFAAKATDTVDINLEGSLLKLAAMFLSDDKPDEARIRRLVAGLSGIHVKTFEFAKDGEYAASDLDSIRGQWKSGGWSRIVSTSSKGDDETSEIFLRIGGKDQLGGLAILSASRREFSVIQILGSIKIEDLKDLAGNFGIPKIELEKKR